MLVRQIINEGIEELIWSEGFNPGDTDDFEKYLMTRFKNEKKSMSKKRMLKESALSISSLMSSTLDQDVLEDVIIFGNDNDVILFFFCFQICLNMKDIVSLLIVEANTAVLTSRISCR